MIGGLKNILAVAKTEFRIGLRNRWVILAALILLAFAGVLSFVGGAPGAAGHINRLTVTVASLATLSVYLVPLLALLLSFDAIAGEIDRGTLSLLLATPVSRLSVIAGKFTGHFAVIAIAVLIGFGGPGLYLYFDAPSAGAAADLVRLIATSAMLGAVFICIGYVVSALAQSSGLAAALAVGVWLSATVLFDLALLGALVADQGGAFSKEVFPWLLAANPADAFRLYNMSALDLGANATGLSGAGDALGYDPRLAILSLGTWIAGAFAAAVLAFRRLQP
ncbi:MAG: ABC transporter permease [Parvularculaceae bacterium]